MGLKRIWQLLTEDPSKGADKSDKPIKKKSKDVIENITPKVAFANTIPNKKDKPKEVKPKVPKAKPRPSMMEQLNNLKYQSAHSNDIKITNFGRSSRYDENYDAYGYWDDGRYGSRDIYRGSRKDYYEVHFTVSGRTMFDRLYPVFKGLTDEQIAGSRSNLDDVMAGVFKIGDEEIEKALVKEARFRIKIYEDTRPDRTSPTSDKKIHFYRSELIELKIFRTLSDQSGIKSRSNKYHELKVNIGTIRSVNESLMSHIYDHFKEAKKFVIEDYKKEVKKTKEVIELKKHLKAFNDVITEDSIKDCFSYAMDEVGPNLCTITKKGGEPDPMRPNSIIYNKPEKEYWRIAIEMGITRESNCNKVPTNSITAFCEITDAINRIKEMCDSCNIEFLIGDKGSVYINIKPILPDWLVKKNKRKSKSDSENAMMRIQLDRIRREYDRDRNRNYGFNAGGFLYE